MTTNLSATSSIPFQTHPEISEIDQRQIQLIWDYDFSFIKERIEESNALSKDKIDEAITEYKKFMTVLRLKYGQIAMSSPIVDEIWHTHILFTRNYQDFCKSVFGEFIHHEPVAGKDKTTEQKPSKRLENFFNSYQEVFGQPPAIWSGKEITGMTGEICYPSGEEICQPSGGETRMKSSNEICYPSGEEICQPSGEKTKLAA